MEECSKALYEGMLAIPPRLDSAFRESESQPQHMWKVLSCCRRVLNDDLVRMDSCCVVRREGFWLLRLFLMDETR